MGLCASSNTLPIMTTNVPNKPPLHSILRTPSGTEEMIVEPGALVFEVSLTSICTRNLEAVDLLSSDPFVVFKFGSTVIQQTQHFDKAQVKCRFPETFGFFYSNLLSDLNNQTLVVEVYDWNRSGKHQLIGASTISLKNIATGPIHHDHQLISTHRKEPKPCGRVSFNCTMQSTDVWKLSFGGYRIIYKHSALEETKGKPFCIRYNFVDNESNITSYVEGESIERPRKAFGKLKVLTFKERNLPPIRWTGSFLKFVSGSLQIQLVCVQPIGFGITTSGHQMTSNEQEFGQVWLPLKKLYSNSIIIENKKKNNIINKKKSAALREQNEEDGGRLSLSSAIATNVPSQASSNRSLESHNSDTVYVRRSSNFDSDLWLMGQKIGSITGQIIFERVPPIGQMASGVLTERGVAAASPVVVGEAVGGTIFRFLNTKTHDQLPKIMKNLGLLFSKMSTVDIRKKKGEAKQRKQMKHVMTILSKSDKYSMISFTYSSTISLLNSQKLLLTIGNWFMDRIEAVETSYVNTRLSYIGVVLILNRGELSDLSTLGFDPLAGMELHKSSIDLKSMSDNHTSHGPTDIQIDMALLIRKYLVRCLTHCINRVRYQTKDNKERRFCAYIFALCSFRLPKFGECMARAILPLSDVKKDVPAWNSQMEVQLSDLSQRTATKHDDNSSFVSELKTTTSMEFKVNKVNNIRQSKFSSEGHDPATMMMDWRRLDSILYKKRQEKYLKQNETLPKSCFDPNYVDEITNEALTREKQKAFDEQQQNQKKSQGETKQSTTKKVWRTPISLKIKGRTPSVLKGERAAGVDVQLHPDNFKTMEEYRKAVKLQKELIHEQSWIIRLRKRQHFFLLVAQAWIQEVIDVVALVQRNIHWYEIPWYREILKAILIEFHQRDSSKYPESLVLLSRALVSNPDVLSPMIYVVTNTTRTHDLAGVSISLALIRSWFVAMSSWNMRKARGCYPLGSLNRTSLPADFQYDYLSSVIITLFDDTLPFQITQKAIEFVYSIWDIIPIERSEALRKLLLEKNIFINLMLHWERNVRIFFAYTIAVRLLQPRKWSLDGGMPSVHFEDFVEPNEEEEEEEEEEDSSDDDEDGDMITIERMNSSSARLTIDHSTHSSKSSFHASSGSFHDGSPDLKALPRLVKNKDHSTYHTGDGFTGAADATGVVINTGNTSPERKLRLRLNRPRPKSRGSVVMASLDLSSVIDETSKNVTNAMKNDSTAEGSPATPTYAGVQHPKGTRRIVLSTDEMKRNSQRSLNMDGERKSSHATNGNHLDNSQSTRTEAETKSNSIRSNRGSSSSLSSSMLENGPTPSQLRMSALIRCIRRNNIVYQKNRIIRINQEQKEEGQQKKKIFNDNEIFDARERPKGGMETRLKDAASQELWRMKQNDMLKDEHEYGSDRRIFGNDNKVDKGNNNVLKIHRGMGGECYNFLIKNATDDDLLLKSDFLWKDIILPNPRQMVYAKDALRLYSLASRRVYGLQEQMEQDKKKGSGGGGGGDDNGGDGENNENGDGIQVPELTFVALVADGHGYKDATTVKEDAYVKIEES